MGNIKASKDIKYIVYIGSAFIRDAQLFPYDEFSESQIKEFLEGHLDEISYDYYWEDKDVEHFLGVVNASSVEDALVETENTFGFPKIMYNLTEV